MSFYSGLFLCSSSLYAEQEWRIILLPENVSENSPEVLVTHSPNNITAEVLQNTSYDQSIEQAIVGQLIAENFEVMDKKSLAPGQKFTSAALSSLSEQEANLAIRYQLTISRQTTITSPKWHYQLALTMVDLLSKNKIETHQASYVFSGIPQGCNKSCQQQWLAQWASQLARDAGAVLVEKLQHLPRRYHYVLTFNNFSDIELSTIHTFIVEEENVVFSELIKNISSQPSLLTSVAGRQYRYVSLLPADKLDVLFNQFFYVQDLAVTKGSSEGKHFNFSRQPQPVWAWGLIVAFIFMALLLFYILVIKTKKEQQASTLLKKTSNKVFKQASEQLIQKLTLLKSQEQQPEHVSQHVYQALSAIDYFILTHQPENKDALLTEKLNVIRLNLINKIIPIQGTVTCNNVYIYQKNILEIGQVATSSTEASTVVDNSIPTQLVLGYKRLKPAGQQVQINYKNGHFYCINQGAARLTLFNYQPLSIGVSQLITHQDRIMLAVNNSDEISPCQLICHQYNSNLVLLLDEALPRLFNETQISTLWPIWQQDIKKRWLLQREKVAIVLDANHLLTLYLPKTEATSTSTTLAWLSYDNGYVITPVIHQAAQSISTPVYINKTAIYKPVIITECCKIVIADQLFNISATI